MGKPLIFLSSTSDMDEEREAIGTDRTLSTGFEIYRFENDRARRASPQERCRQMINRSDVFLCLVGVEPGSSLPGTEKSIVQWEYETAAARDEMALMFFVDEDVNQDGIDPLQREFVEELTSFQSGRWCKFFEDSSELVQEAQNSLLLWLTEFYQRLRERKAEGSSKLRGLLTGIIAGALVLLAGLIILQVTASVLTTSAVVASSSAVAAVGFCGMILLKYGGLSHEFRESR